MSRDLDRCLAPPATAVVAVAARVVAAIVVVVTAVVVAVIAAVTMAVIAVVAAADRLASSNISTCYETTA